jgi:RNA polymerase sigma-B factor
MAEAFAFQNDPDELVARYVEHPRPDLKDMIMIQYASLVERTARRFSGLETHEDLVQVGFIGLLNALSKFDPKAGVRFNTYASHLVAGEIKHYLRDRSQTIRHPAWLQELRHKVNKTANLLQSRLGRVPTESEIAYELDVSEQAVREVFQTQEMLKVASLDAPAPDDEGGSGEGEQLDAAAYCPEQLSVEDRVLLESAMRQLRDLERDVLVMFHFEALNQSEIADRLGISCNYVSHILRQSLSKLRRILANEEEQERLLQRQTRLADDSVLDASTGSYSEEYFRARLEEEVHRAASSEGVLSIVLLEFSGLEEMAGFYGEASVRDFLIDAGEFLKECTRRLDVVCRFGESGFAVILPSTGPSATIVRQRLTQRLESWVQGKQGPTGAVKARLGHAVYPDDGLSAAELLEGATPREVPTSATVSTDQAA